ncbi:response regulator [Pararhizobium sp.]|uniref:response regulator n=1 Tax=Pararhizobium sp. TaxID=1977563 RepID=UPI002717C924|nr:response regulator [Pararhizobium sp.]MDO9414671.1 response regulator [Pararhizobium sp.]
MAAAPDKPALLVVEDDGLIRLDLVYTLEDMGYGVLEAANADEAIKTLEKSPNIVAVLTDIDMPGPINGLTLAKIVHDDWAHCKVLVISGRYHPSEHVLPPGARFLTKPISDTLLGRVLAEAGIMPG